MTDAAQTQAGGLEVRLLRRLPAQPARLRGRAAGVAGAVEIAYFPRPSAARAAEGRTICRWSRARSPPRTTPSASASAPAQSQHAGHDRRLRDRRRHPGAAQLRRRQRIRCHRLCRTRTTSRRWRPRPPIAAHVPVDFELRGCPINKRQLLEVISAFLADRRPVHRRRTASASSASGAAIVCVMVAHGTPCLGPVTHAGCGAICPAYNRGCYGCFGPKETPNTPSLARESASRLAWRSATSRACSAPSMPPPSRSARRAERHGA